MLYLITKYYNNIYINNIIYYKKYPKDPTNYNYNYQTNNKKSIKLIIDNKNYNYFTNKKKMKYAFTCGCPWDLWTCELMARFNSLECLKYAHKNNCLWNKFTCIEAASNNNLKCLKYAHKNNCS